MVDGYSRITNKVYNIRTYVFDEIDYNDSQNHIEISSMSDIPYGKVRVSGYLGLLTYFIRILITVKTSMSSHRLSITYEVCSSYVGHDFISDGYKANYVKIVIWLQDIATSLSLSGKRLGGYWCRE